LYEQLGFEPLGPAVPCGQARFVPMVVTPERIKERIGRAIELWRKRLAKQGSGGRSQESGVRGQESGVRSQESGVRGRESAEVHGRSEGPSSLTPGPWPLTPAAVCLLPGPVAIAPAVRAAFQQPPLYHRAAEFIERFEEVRRRLGDLVGGCDVALWTGSG